MSTNRMTRVNELLRRVVGEAITELARDDDGIGFVTVTQVDTSPDLRSARVFVSVLGDEAAREASLEALTEAHADIQAEIASQTRMKRTPTLTFRYDDAPERGMRISRILDDIDHEEDGDGI